MGRPAPAQSQPPQPQQAQTKNNGAYHGRKLDRGNCGKLYKQFTRGQIMEQQRR